MIKRVWVVIEESSDGTFVIGVARTARLGRKIAQADYDLSDPAVPLNWVGRAIDEGPEYREFFHESWVAYPADRNIGEGEPLYMVTEMKIEKD